MGEQADHHHTARRSIRVPDEIWDAALEKSRRTGIPISHVVREALTEWTRDERKL